MDLDIETDHVAMRPEWHRQIDEWVHRCRRVHPGVVALDMRLRHGARPQAGEEVELVATARGPRPLRVGAHAGLMTVALHDAFEALERELLVREAASRRV